MNEKLIQEYSKKLKDISLGIKFVGTLGIKDEIEFDEFTLQSKFMAVSKLIDEVSAKSLVHPAFKIIYRKALNLKSKIKLLLSNSSNDFNLESLNLFGENISYLEQVASQFDIIWKNYENSTLSLNLSNDKIYTAKQVSFYLQKELSKEFSDTFCIKLSSKILSKASCGKNYIKINSKKNYSESDLETFYIHEGLVHLLTNLNAKNQLEFFSVQCSKTTRTQEGLAIFSEFFTGIMSKERFDNLKWRYICCLKAIKNESKDEIYNYLISNNVKEQEANSLLKRVFRGKKSDQQQIFVKDLAYLLGFVEVYQFIEKSVFSHQFELVELLYSVKSALEDIEEIKELEILGFINEAKYKPNFLNDYRSVLQRMSQLNLLKEVDLPLSRAEQKITA